jgi:peptidoglycan/LPS O-acetylase OafA/YrhL
MNTPVLMERKGTMWRARTLKVVLVLVGLIFSAGVYPLTSSLWHQDPSMYAFDMMLSLYVALGIFLLIAARNPSANRSLIAFTAWSGFAHAAVMAVTSFSKGGYRGDLWGVAVLVIIGIALIALGPAKQSGERVSAAI